jgi:hypothetical protein
MVRRHRPGVRKAVLRPVRLRPSRRRPLQLDKDGVRQLSGWFVAGTIVVFDEYFGYHGWQRHEDKAFQEFLSRTGLSFEAIGLGHMNLAVRLING